MDRISHYLQQIIASLGGIWGGFGLFFIAFFDSSFLSLPEINDILILYFCTRFKEYAYFYALMAMLGSTAGCSVLYWVGKWKGYGFLERKYSQTKLKSALRIFQRYGVFAVIGPALMPPPFPFKIFVLSAGILGLSFPRFLAAVLFGRGFRYFFEATLAIRYGDRALAYIEANYAQVAVAALGLVVAGFVVYQTFVRPKLLTADEPVATPNPD
jgi:undecaprenyl-diphosphatase